MGMNKMTCGGCGYPLRVFADADDAFVIDLAGDRGDAVRPEAWGLPRLDGNFYCPPNPYAINVTGHIPA